MGIKSFQGRRNQPKKEELKPAIVSDFMTRKLITFKPDQPMPVENDTVDKHMVRNVETIDGNLNVFDAAQKFLDSKRRRFPIVENGKLVGQISQKDILIATMEQKGQNWR